MKAILTFTVLLAACTGMRPAAPPTAVIAARCIFTNPVAPGADPWIVRHDGYYYMVASEKAGITVYKSATLTDPHQNGVVVWTAPATGWNSTNIWAPELHFIGGRWYIYYAGGSSGPPFVHQHAGVLESAGTDPQQPGYLDRGVLYTGDSIATGRANRWAIDLTVHTLGDRLYAVWSGWIDSATTDRTQQHLFMARMSDPRTIATNRVKISSPTESWELQSSADGLSLNEGPEFLERNGKVFVIYSTGESWLTTYKLGQLELRAPRSDPMNPAMVVKTGPVFAGTSTVFGVGHASFTTSPDGSEDWIVYHAKRATSPGWDRDVREQRFTWTADGSPNFGTPVTAGVPLARPAGECPASGTGGQ